MSQGFSNLGMIRITRSGGDCENRRLGPTPRFSDSVGLGQGLRMCWFGDHTHMHACTHTVYTHTRTCYGHI